MWKASAGVQLNISKGSDVEDDDWETDPDFVNDVSEEEQRWGSKTVEGSGRTAGAINMQQLREETEKADADKKKKEFDEINPNYGYGGKYGIQKDRMDKSAVGHDYIGKTEKHASQKDYSTGFGGKFGIQSDRVDKSALGWDHVEKVEKHESQKDYAKGFGGKFGVQEDRKDKSAVGWDYIEAPKKHESQVDHKVGFGGKFGVQSDRMDKSAIGFDDQNNERIGTNYTKVKPDIGGAKPSNLRAKFENLAKSSEEDNQQKVAEQKRIREAKDKQDRDEASKRQDIEGSSANVKVTNNRKTEKFNTGREGGIGNAISAFNQMQTSTELQQQPVQQRKDPIQLPKDEKKPIQPDIIPVKEPEPEISVQEQSHQVVLEQNIHTENVENIVAPPPKEFSEPPYEEPIYENQEYIEDTGIKAIALYDYQAAAEDEISFDPDDLISHIEMIDEGWWRGLCKNRYGLFPANYVQLQEQQQA